MERTCDPCGRVLHPRDPRPAGVDYLVQKIVDGPRHQVPGDRVAIKAADRRQDGVDPLRRADPTAATARPRHRTGHQMKAKCPKPLSPPDQVVALADRSKPVSPLRE